MIPRDFAYHAPASVDEAVALLGRHGDEAKVHAGGHGLIPPMKLRLAGPSHLVDITRIAALKRVREDGGEICIEPMTTQREVIASELLWSKCPLIPEEVAVELLAEIIADRRRGGARGRSARRDGRKRPARGGLLRRRGRGARLTGPVVIETLSRVAGG